jgi:hypothetical protein
MRCHIDMNVYIGTVPVIFETTRVLVFFFPTIYCGHHLGRTASSSSYGGEAMTLCMFSSLAYVWT